MRIKIVSDGIGDHTKVVNAETGEDIENVSEVEWKVNAGGIASAFLMVDFAEIEAESDVKESRLFPLQEIIDLCESGGPAENKLTLIEIIARGYVGDIP